MADVAQTFIDNSAAREQQALLRQQRLAEILQQQAFQPDQKFSYAGVEASPSAAGALAKGLQGGIAGYLQGRALKGQDDLVKKTEAREERYGTDLAKALGAANTKPWVNPDGPGAVGNAPIYQAGASGLRSAEDPAPPPQMMPGADQSMTPFKAGPAGGYEAIAAALQNIGNPDVTRSLGPQITMQQMARKEKLADEARAFANANAMQGREAVMGPGGNVTGVRPIQGFGQTMGAIEADKIGATTPALAAQGAAVTGATSQAALPAQRALSTFNSAQETAAAGPRAAAVAAAQQPYKKAEAIAKAALEAPGKLAEAAGKLRDDFNGQSPVKNYKEVVPIFASMQDAMKRDNAAADLNIVYGIAKLMDPASVVRESETAMAIKSGSPAEQFQGTFNYILGGGRLTPETRARLFNEARSRAQSHQSAYDDIASQFTQIAKRGGVNPEDVITGLTAPKITLEKTIVPGGEFVPQPDGSLNWVPNANR
jgi:hypothetical protein